MNRTIRSIAVGFAVLVVIITLLAGAFSPAVALEQIANQLMASCFDCGAQTRTHSRIDHQCECNLLYIDEKRQIVAAGVTEPIAYTAAKRDFVQRVMERLMQDE